MECVHRVPELDSCAAIEANLVPMTQSCVDCKYFKQEEEEK